MATLQLDLDEHLLDLLRQVKDPAEDAAQELIVMELHRRGLVSGGKGAELLGLSRLAFIQRAAEFGIPYFNYGEEDWKAELAAIEKLTHRPVSV